MKKIYKLISDKQAEIVKKITTYEPEEALMSSNLSEKPKIIPHYSTPFFGEFFKCSSFFDDNTKELYLCIFHSQVNSVIYKISYNGNIDYFITKEEFYQLKELFFEQAILNKKRKSFEFLTYMSDILKAHNEGKSIEILKEQDNWVPCPSSNIFLFDSCQYRIAKNQVNVISNYSEDCLKVIEAFKNGKQIEKKHKNDSDDMFKIEENPEWNFFYYRYRIM